jgi:hypothetical protein
MERRSYTWECPAVDSDERVSDDAGAALAPVILPFTASVELCGRIVNLFPGYRHHIVIS